MTPIVSRPGNGRYLIRSEQPARLAEFIASIPANPDLELVDAIGPPGQPHTAVVDMSHAMAAALEQSFRQSDHLKIEPDRPLSLFVTGGL